MPLKKLKHFLFIALMKVSALRIQCIVMGGGGGGGGLGRLFSLTFSRGSGPSLFGAGISSILMF